MRLPALVAAASLMSAAVVSAIPAPAGVTWEAEGLSELPAALARAKKSGRRLLIGLSGGPG